MYYMSASWHLTGQHGAKGLVPQCQHPKALTRETRVHTGVPLRKVLELRVGLNSVLCVEGWGWGMGSKKIKRV